MFSMVSHLLGSPSVGRFEKSFACYSVSMCPGNERQDVERGGKIIMPPSVLGILSRLHIQYPMLFKLENRACNRETHSGVLEFVAEEGRVYLPSWMMRNLLLEEGHPCNITSISLPVASYAKFQPQSSDFLEISNPKAVLENALRNFACLTSSDIIAITYNQRLYELRVLETKPQDAVTIIECDMNVEFAPPVGFQEPQQVPETSIHEDDENERRQRADQAKFLESSTFRAFRGSGIRLDGKKKGTESDQEVPPSGIVTRGIPNYDYKPYTITFFHSVRNEDIDANDDSEVSFTPFGGAGKPLRERRGKQPARRS